jgi:hypothetical protein
MAEAIPYIALAISAGTTIYSMTLNTDVEPSDTGSLVNKAGTQSTRDVVYGECLTGATIVYSNVKDNDSSTRLDIFSLGVAVSSIKQVLIDDVEVLVDDNPKRETTDIDSLTFTEGNLKNGFEKQCSIQLRTGEPIGTNYINGLPVGTPMNLAIQNSDGEWTTAMRGDYVAAIAVTSKRIIDDESIRIMGDTFKVNALAEGVPVYDPRRGGDPAVKQYRHASGVNPECGRNPALVALDYITNTYYGMKIDYKFIDINSFINAANWCDSKGFKVDGQLNQGETFATNIDNICKSAGITPIIINNKFHLLYQDAALPVASFDSLPESEGGLDNILNKNINIKEQSSGQYVNCVETNYKNADLLDQTDTYVVPANLYPEAQSPDYPSQIQQDGYLETGTLDLPMVRMFGNDTNNVNSQIRYLTNVELNRQKFQKEIDFEIDLDEDPINIFDVIEVTNLELGWDKKQFRVIEITSRFSDKEYNVATVLCKEHDNSIYSSDLVGTPPSERPPETVDVAPPVNLVFNQYNTGLNSSATLSWQRTYFETDSSFIVEYKKSSSSSWVSVGRVDTTSFEFPLLPYDSYDFRVATYSNLYGSSVFTELLNQQVSSFGTLPPVTGTSVVPVSKDFDITWDNMLDEAVSLPLNPDPKAPSNPTVKDYFSHYEIVIYHDSLFKKRYKSVDSKFTYTFDENTTNGTSRIVKAEVFIVANDGSKSQLSTGSSSTGTNTQHPQLSGVTADDNQFSSVSIRWDTSTEGDYFSTTLRRKAGANGSYEYINVVGSFYTDILPDADPVGTVYYYNVAARDVFDNNNLNWSAEITATKQSIDSIRPEFNDELDQIRNPDNASNEVGELVISTTNPSKDKVAGFGLYAPEGTGNTKAIFAADEFVISAGGYTEWDSTKTYNIGDKVTVTIAPDVQQLYQCFESSTGDFPPDSEIQWSLVLGNTYQGAFYFDSITDQLILRSAVIKELDAGAITTGTLDADRIAANSIEGGKIRSDTTIIAGQVSDVIGENGETVSDLDGFNDSIIEIRTYTDFFTGYTNDCISVYPNKLTSETIIDGQNSWTESTYDRDLMAFGVRIEWLRTNPDDWNRQPGSPARDEEESGSALGFLPQVDVDILKVAGYEPWESFQYRLDNIPNEFYVGYKGTMYRFYAKDANKNYYLCDDKMFTSESIGRDQIIFSENDIDLISDIIIGESNIVGLNGDDSNEDYKGTRIFAGGNVPASSPMTVDYNGVIRARGADIEGNIQAETGYFKGTLSGADFRGSYIYGAEMESGTFVGGTIIGSTIYASQQQILADPYNNGTITYYVSYPSIPVAVQENIDLSFTFKPNRSSYTFFDSKVIPSFENEGEISELRTKFPTIPQGTITLEQSPYSFKATGRVYQEMPSVYIELVSHVTNTVLDTIEVSLDPVNNGGPYGNTDVENEKFFTFAGVSWALRSSMFDNTETWRINYIRLENLQSTFGGFNSPNNGKFRIGFKSGYVYAGVPSRGYNYYSMDSNVTARTKLNNPV